METTLDTTTIFERVAEGELTPAQGAELLRSQREVRRKPSWMPNWTYAFLLVVMAVLLAPFSSTAKSRGD